jgi:hypothetical protein
MAAQPCRALGENNARFGAVGYRDEHRSGSVLNRVTQVPLILNLDIQRGV